MKPQFDTELERAQYVVRGLLIVIALMLPFVIWGTVMIWLWALHV